MNRQRSFEEYRRLDLMMMAMMLVIFEFIIIKVTNSRMFADQAFTVSLAASITTIVYMRWGIWGGLYAALAGFIYCFYSGGTLNHYLIYIAGNLFSLPAVAVLKKLGYERVRTSKAYLLFPLLVILLMQTGRMLVAIVLGTRPEAALGFVTTDVLSILFTLVIIWIARRSDGLYENQKHYLLRVHEEEKRNRNMGA